MQIGKTLSNAWKLIWKNKILWLFGILAGASSLISTGSYSGSGGGHSASSGSSSWLFPGSERAGSGFAHSAYHNALTGAAFMENNPWIFIVIGIVVVILTLGLVVVSFFLGALGISGVIKGTKLGLSQIAEDKPLSLKTIFQEVKPVYWQVILFTLLVSGAKLLLGLILGALIVGFTIVTLGIGLLLLLPFIFLIIPVSFFINLLIINALIALVYEGKPIFKSFERSWRVTTSNLGEMLLLLLILTVGQFILTLIIIGPVIMSYIPFGLAFMIGNRAWMIIILIITGLLATAVTLLGILLSGVITAYVLSAWTINYQHSIERLAEKEAVERKPAELTDNSAT